MLIVVHLILYQLFSH